MLIKVDASGAIVEEIAIPAELAAQSSRFGFEGVAVTGSGADDETVWLAVQREWKDDPKGLAKRLAYKPGSKSCGAVHYPLDKTETGWVGLSEITSVPNGFVVIERDNQIGQAAKIKKLSFIVGAELVSSPLGSSLPVVKKNELRAFFPTSRLMAVSSSIKSKVLR